MPATRSTRASSAATRSAGARRVKSESKPVKEEDDEERPRERARRSGQAGWSRCPGQTYEIVAPAPTRDDVTREFTFEEWPTFKPNVSPEEMLRAGVFGGSYFRTFRSPKSRIEHTDDWLDLPEAWYTGLDVEKYLTSSTYEPSVNKWKAKVGQSLEEWENAGWMSEYDCRGWAQWYMRFFRGRRCPDDARQVSRWDRLAGRRGGRWRRILLGKYMSAGLIEIEPHRETISPGIRQTLLHWAFEPTTEHLDEFRDEKGDSVANDDHELDSD